MRFQQNQIIDCPYGRAMFMAAAPAYAKDKRVRVYKGKPAKYVFLFIGDGMGLPQKGATEAFTGEQLLMNSSPHRE